MGPQVQEHPYYHEGFADAGSGEPLYPDAHPVYAMGWAAFHECARLLAGRSPA